MASFDELTGSTGDEEQFQSWYAGHAKNLGLHPNPDHPEHFYDFRGAYAAGSKPDASGHWPSKFKLEGHPRMVIDGVNTKTGEPAIGGALGGQLEQAGGALAVPQRPAQPSIMERLVNQWQSGARSSYPAPSRGQGGQR